VYEDDLDACLRGISEAHEERREYQMQYRLRRADGEYRLLLCNGVPRFEPDGTFVGFITSWIDITELNRSKEEALARQKLESLGVLTSGIAHDFNNLLGGIMADAQLLMGELEKSSPALESAKRIDTVAFRASEIVRQLMAYAGQESSDYEPVDMVDLVRDMLDLIHVSISKHCFLKVELPEGLPMIRANAAQIRQVIMNLITNASQALEGKEGVISVSLGEVHPNEESRFLRLEVSDTGCGMTKEIQDRIFDPFFSTKGAGRGMGLASLQGIVRTHGGNTSVVSVPGQGSRFDILLPCLKQAEKATRDNAIPSSAATDRSLTGTVLLIEDEDALRSAVTTMLRKKGFSVFDAGDGMTGLDLFQAHTGQIDAVLMDATLPGMTGREVLEKLRGIRPDVTVILTSAYGRDVALETVGGGQSLPYIRKPYQVSDLIDLILRTCSGEVGLRATD
jgi:signal transduction histidine kinase/CheY-like chemotaxis protein